MYMLFHYINFKAAAVLLAVYNNRYLVVAYTYLG